MLRTPEWIADYGAHVGGTVWLNMPEMGACGEAEVLDIGPAQAYDVRPGLVTGTFKHTSGDVYDLKLESESKPIGVTGTHPFWSMDRDTWVSVLDLEIGETLKTLEGTTVVESRVRRPAPEVVYNIEVEGDHCYRVGESGVLVHNASLKKLGCAVLAVPTGKLYRGSGKSGIVQFLSDVADQFGVEEAEKDVAANEKDPARKKRVFSQQAVRGHTEYASTSSDVRIAFVFATDHNRRDGYIYVIDDSRAEFNTESVKKTHLPGDKKGTSVEVPENEWLFAVSIESPEILGEYRVSKFKQD